MITINQINFILQKKSLYRSDHLINQSIIRKRAALVCLSGLFLVGCTAEASEIAGSYTVDNSTIEITNKGKVTVSENLTALSTLEREMHVINDDDDILYKMNPDEDYIWTYTINKSDSEYDTMMDEMLYFVESHNFTTKDSGDNVVVSGAFDDAYFGEFAISYDDPVITDSEEGLYFYSTLISE